MASSLFIADLHLTPERPGPAASFRRLLEQQAVNAEALYILGDLFEAWVGDDDLALPFHADLASRLKQLADAGIRIFLLPGNRDFLAGEELGRAAGMTLLPDPTRIDLYGTPTLLAHGDAWCTDDVPYQALRSQLRQPTWRREFLARPLAERHAIASALREQSEQAKSDKRPDIMDVNPKAIEEAFRHHGVSRIIHGHTHRPDHHLHTLAGQTCERWVLPDWYGTQGGYLTCSTSGCHMKLWP